MIPSTALLPVKNMKRRDDFICMASKLSAGSLAYRLPSILAILMLTLLTIPSPSNSLKCLLKNYAQVIEWETMILVPLLTYFS